MILCKFYANQEKRWNKSVRPSVFGILANQTYTMKGARLPRISDFYLQYQRQCTRNTRLWKVHATVQLLAINLIIFSKKIRQRMNMNIVCVCFHYIFYGAPYTGTVVQVAQRPNQLLWAFNHFFPCVSGSKSDQRILLEKKITFGGNFLQIHWNPWNNQRYVTSSSSKTTGSVIVRPLGNLVFLFRNVHFLSVFCKNITLMVRRQITWENIESWVRRWCVANVYLNREPALPIADHNCQQRHSHRLRVLLESFGIWMRNIFAADTATHNNNNNNTCAARIYA